MQFLKYSLVALLVVGCTAVPTTGDWPEAKIDRSEIERVSLKGRIVIIEQVPRFLQFGSAQVVSPSLDHYLFWDFCRGSGTVWQMVALRPDERASSGWSYTRTRTFPATKRHEAETRVTEGFLERRIAGFEDLRKAGLSFFKPGTIKCDATYGDPI
ncbi:MULTISPECIES: hypothetical protein [Kordiimonas]|jgi:hypothetical protein|uniref:Lipoprotein n=1 Tax=Kordiimonas lacus TaxID=637679 RepID=A0A1G7A143_9PROT|nr:MULTISPECIES: hypothetical protein [Kordiimonas]SDE08461.1 hypothetical protein SAMN04488071_2041 [Kordiimonas lacus]